MAGRGVLGHGLGLAGGKLASEPGLFRCRFSGCLSVNYFWIIIQRFPKHLFLILAHQISSLALAFS